MSRLEGAQRRGERFIILLFSAFCLSATSSTPVPDIRGIVPPQPFYLAVSPFWLVLAAVSLVLAGAIIWFTLRRKPAKPPPLLSPREIATQQLQELENRLENMDPRTFGGEVCEVLRVYISRQYGLHPQRQTSPEFLNSITGSRVFSVVEHSLLTDFLDGCDLLKFARVDATLDGKRRLLLQAREFLIGGAPPPLPAHLPNLTAA